MTKQKESRFDTKTWLVALAVAGASSVPAALSAQYLPQNPGFGQPSSPAVKSLGTLAGCWKGMGPHGRNTRIYYELASDGTALIEHLQPEDTESYQLTIYYLEGETPVAQHFCYYGSQIKMKADAVDDPSSVTFRFADATNLDMSNHEDYMTFVKLSFPDADHLVADWGSITRGEEKVSNFSLTRVVDNCRGLDFSW